MLGRARPTADFFRGRRPWALVAFFFVLGLANIVKGLFFGDLVILVTVAAYLLLGGERWSMIQRYVWLPGWVVFAVTGSAWAIAAYLRYPDVVDLWKSDYVGRLNQGYMGEGVWYYPVHLPWVLFPWTAAAFLGLWMTRGQAFGHGRTPERFLWCWALVPIIFLSIPQGKHHHYLLHGLAPWAILAGLGTVRLFEVLPKLDWLRTPWLMLLALGLPGEIALAVVVPRFPTPDGLLPAVLVLWPVLVLTCWWIFTRKQLLGACVALFALVIVGHWVGYLHPVYIERRYGADLAFLDEVQKKVPAEAPLLVLDAKGPLDPSWLLYYLNGRGTMLHNITFLRDGRFDFREAYLIARPWQVRELPEYGQGREIARSAHTWGEWGPHDRLTLYRVRFHDHLARHQGPVYISPMQATGRAVGPMLTQGSN
jgi:4-amino-4-deoxy-L-arabinose transferase-like glycosyltransferase